MIWQESGFKPNAVGPMTRSGQRARGVAQFMPGTASDRGLFDLFDPVAALPKSAEFLAELHAEFGNLGLAAAAYNAGPQRVRDWIAGPGGLPAETRNYVIAITGAASTNGPLGTAIIMTWRPPRRPLWRTDCDVDGTAIAIRR